MHQPLVAVIKVSIIIIIIINLRSLAFASNPLPRSSGNIKQKQASNIIFVIKGVAS